MQRDSEKKKERQESWKKVQFIVTREFSGSQTMQEAFEQLIERQACGQFEEWLGLNADLKAVAGRAGAWYYNCIVSLFIEKENDYEQEKSNQPEDNCPLLQAFP